MPRILSGHYLGDERVGVEGVRSQVENETDGTLLTVGRHCHAPISTAAHTRATNTMNTGRCATSSVAAAINATMLQIRTNLRCGVMLRAMGP